MSWTSPPARAEHAHGSGLTTAEATSRLDTYGPNLVPQPRRLPIVFRVGRQLADPLILLLLAAAVVTSALRDFTDTAAILLVVAVNTAIGVSQEVRADRAVSELSLLAAPNARVMRDGQEVVLPVAELAPGDRVVLDAGDVVPADLRLDTAAQLSLNEAMLTGEALPVARSEADDALAGTVVLAGRGAGVVTRTGAASALGTTASLVAKTRPPATPLQRRLARLGWVLGAVVLVLSGVVLLIGLARGRAPADMAIAAVSLAVGAVPKSLPAVVTVALALGAGRMAARSALVRRLPAVETLGSVTVVASDKTGTLTQNRMAVSRAVTRDWVGHSVVGEGYAPVGAVRRDDSDRVAGVSGELTALARAGLLCNDAALVPPSERDGSEWTAVGDPLEAALVAFAGRCGLDPSAVREAWPRLAERPFDAERRRMSTAHRTPDGAVLTVCKGAPEAVLTREVLAEPDSVLATAQNAARRLASEGLRVLAVAAVHRREHIGTRGLAERGLRFVGLVGINDPLRVQAADVAGRLATAGVRLVLVTGDHPATAVATAGQLGVWRRGDTIARGDDQAGTPHIDRVRVFARTRPGQKLDIVGALQRNGDVVAMTGDGANDAPALRRADIGVAMGTSGTEAARQASELVLVDDNLATLGAAVEEGRRVYANIRRFLRYGLAGGLAEILVMLAGPFAGLALPLLPAQILWINLLGLPGVALGAEPAEPDAMRRPPRPPGESVLGAGLLWSVLLAGSLLAAIAVGVGVWGALAGRPWQSMLFVALGLGQLALAFAVRARSRTGGGVKRLFCLGGGRSGTGLEEEASRVRRLGHNPWLFAAVTMSAILQVAAVCLAPLRALLGTSPLSLSELAICASVAIIPGLAVYLSRAQRGMS